MKAMKSQWRGVGVLSLVIAVFLVVLCGGPAFGQQAERLSVTVGQIQIVDTPFAVRSFSAADKSVVKVEQNSERQLKVTGLRAGATDLQVSGEGQASALYTINVLENVENVVAAMKKDLDTVPEVEIGANMNRVVVKGEVSSIEHWRLLKKVIDLYAPVAVNLATFRPTPEVMLALKTAFDKLGYKTQQEGDAVSTEPGTIAMKYSGNNLFISGLVYSSNDVGRIMSVIEAQDWLAVTPKGDTVKADEPKVAAFVDLKIVPVMLELDAVFVGVTDKEEKEIGVNLAKAGLVVIDTTAAAFAGTIGADRSSGWTGSYTINSGLKGALQFFSGGGPGRTQNAGHMTFRNDAPDWKSYQSGGTLKVRTATQNVIGLNDIDYGLIMKVRGGLIDANTAELDLQLELSYPVPIGSDYDLKRNRVETSVNCPLGQTLVMAGMKSLIEQSSKDGVPFLKSIPVISWFFSEKTESLSDTKVLILMSPQLAPGSRPTAPVSAETMTTEQEAAIPVKERK